MSFDSRPGTWRAIVVRSFVRQLGVAPTIGRLSLEAC